MSHARLSAPRLEFRWEKTGEEEYICTYSLVLPLKEHDIRKEDGKDEYFVEMSKTTMTTGNESGPVRDGKVELPFRDGAHARWDNEALGGHLPIVAIYGNVVNYY